MAKIDKSKADIPAILKSGDPRNKSEVELLLLETAFGHGKVKFHFKPSIYGHKKVKEALAKLQHDKCCFCESKVGHISHGDVEHYRPKGGYYSQPKEKMKYPGYYWAAYQFSNLYFACQICNQSFKKNYFPVIDENNRVASHHDKALIDRENPLIIDPGEDEPSLHITFDREVPRGLDEKGRTTIKRTGLDRKKLNDIRFDWYKMVVEIARHAKAGDAVSLYLLRQAAKSIEPYSLMIRCNFPDLLS